jgi:hypothetical protein
MNVKHRMLMVFYPLVGQPAVDGWLEIAAGIPARNEWPEMFSEFFPRCLCMRSRMVLLKSFSG